MNPKPQGLTPFFSLAAVTVRAIKAGSPQDQGQTASRTGVLPPKTETLAYDADGNLTADGLWTYTYNARNELVAMTTKLSSGDAASRRNLTFAYDYLGRRIRKTVTDPVTSATTIRRYLYDGWNLVAEYEEAGGALGALKRSYTWGLDVAGSLAGTGGVGALVQLSVHGGGTVTDYYPTYDGNGNVAALVKSDGTLAAAYEYDPFGQVLRREALDSAVADNPFGFSTKFTDVETGLVYYGHRYYSPGLGRFINRDPIGEQGGLNLYAFVGNDPVNGIDALGLKELKDYLPLDTPGDIINAIRDYLPRGGYFIADKVKGLAYWSLSSEGGTTPNGIADIFPAAQVAEYLRVVLMPAFEVEGDPSGPRGGIITINNPGSNGGGGGGGPIASAGGGGAAPSSGAAPAPNSEDKKREQLKKDCAERARLAAEGKNPTRWEGPVNYEFYAFIASYGRFEGVLIANEPAARTARISGKLFGVGVQGGYVTGQINRATWLGNSPSEILGSNGVFFNFTVGVGAGPVDIIGYDAEIAANRGPTNADVSSVQGAVVRPGLSTTFDPANPASYLEKPKVGLSVGGGVNGFQVNNFQITSDPCADLK